MNDAALRDENPAIDNSPDLDLSFDVSTLLNEVEEQAHIAGDEVPPPPAELAHLVTGDNGTPRVEMEEATPDGPLDAAGQAFDPNIHATDQDGSPKKTKAGNWAKKRGRKSKGADIKAPENASKFNAGHFEQTFSTHTDETSPDMEAIGRAKMRAETGKTMANITVLASVMAGGEDFTATQTEVDEMGASYAAYLEARGFDAPMSPEMVLAGQLSNYFLPRVFKPKVKDRVKFGFKWIKEKTLSLFAKAKARGNVKKAEKQEKEVDENNASPVMSDWPF